MARRTVSSKTRKRSKYSKKYNRNKSVRGGDRESDIDGEKVATKAFLELKSLVMTDTKKSDSPPKNMISELKELSNNDNIPNGSPKFVNEENKIITDGIEDIAADTAGAKVKTIYNAFAKKISSGSKKEALDGIDVLLEKLKDTMKQNNTSNSDASKKLLNGLMNKRNELANISFEPNSKSASRSRFIKIGYALTYSILAIIFTGLLVFATAGFFGGSVGVFAVLIKANDAKDFLIESGKHLIDLPLDLVNVNYGKYFTEITSNLYKLVVNTQMSTAVAIYK
jgi:hypothetical protein